MNNFWTRIISGIGLILATITLFYLGSWGLLTFSLLVAIGGNQEWFKLRKMRYAWGWIVSAISSTITLFLVHFGEFKMAIFPSMAILALSIYLAKNHYRSAISLLGAQLYLTLPLSFLLTLPYVNPNSGLVNSDESYNFLIPSALMALVWSADSWAYVSGKLFGKNKLAPAISPGKTWEGFFGGTLLTGVTAYLIHFLFFNADSYFNALKGEHLLQDSSKLIIIGLLVSIFGTMGDLFESSLKRRVNIKDSGNIIPGHGGVLDRYDAFLFAIVVFTVAYRYL